MIKKGTNPFFNPQYGQFSNGIFNTYIAPTLFLLCWILIILGIFCMLIPSVSAAQTMNSSVNVTGITDTTITFEVKYKNTIRATGATFDGIAIEGYDLSHDVNYTANNLHPNTTHTFCIYKDLINCETATTTDTKDSSELILDFIYAWIWFILSVIGIIIGFRIPLGSIIALILSLIGFLNSLLIYHDFLMFMLYVTLLFASTMVSYKGIKG